MTDTHLRDARLRQALAHAPDQDARPGVNTRIAIHSIAYKPYQKSRNGLKWFESGWLDAWTGWLSPRRPWNAAFAMLLLGGLITLLWQHEPLPEAGAPPSGAAPAAPAADTNPQAAAPAAAPVATPAAPPTQEAMARAPAAIPAKPATAVPESRSAPAGNAAARSVAPPSAGPAPEPAATRLPRPATAPPPDLAARDTASALPPAPAAATETPAPQAKVWRSRPEAETGSSGRLLGSTRPAAAPAAATAPSIPDGPAAPAAAAPTQKSAEAAPGGNRLSPLPPAPAWTTLELYVGPRSVRLARAETQALLQRAQELLDGAEPLAQVAAPAQAPQLQILLQDGAPEPVAVLLVWDDLLLWQRRGAPARLARVPAQAHRALLLEANARLGR